MWFIAADFSIAALEESLLYVVTTLQKQLFREEMKSTPTWINMFEAVALQEMNYSYAAA